MNEILSEIRRYIKNGYYRNEENVRLSIVARILQKLDWNIWDPREVATEFPVLPNEDSTRVDIALFESPYTPPSVFIETKAMGKLESDLSRYEIQLRDYNRNNTALFSIITDGRIWRFYYSQTGGEFSQKCFKILDLLIDDIEDIELSMDAFLSKEEIRNGNAKNEAETYLRLNQKQRAMEDALPKARRLVLENPFPSLPQSIVDLVKITGFPITIEEALKFIEKQSLKKLTEIKPSQPIDRPGTRQQIRRTHSIKRGILPPNGTMCRFNYKGKEFIGKIKIDELFVSGYGTFTSFSRASSDLTNTMRNGWLDWEIQLPGEMEWISANSWRNKHK